MKIQIDTDKKVLRIESDVKLSELFDKLEKLFPDGTWRDYTLETDVQIQWTNPIYIDRYYPSYPWWKWDEPYKITSGDSLTNHQIAGTVYNVEC